MFTRMTTETCADCGKPISQNEGHYVTTDPWGKGGPNKYHHSACGDPFGIKAAVALERERIAAAVERLDNTMMNQDKLAAYIRKVL
jgi:hypothetical protein